MTYPAISRRAFAIGTGALGAALGGSNTAQAATATSTADAGITGGHEAIHQEAVFKATPAQVYRALTDARLFDKVVVASGAIPRMALGKAPTRIDRAVGGAFSLFGGYITGRHVELTPGVRVIQAWRSGSWAPHIFSIARFELVAEGGGARLVFDQTGFPAGEAASLAKGWHENYWMPLAKVLA
jgi:activator of HSP90 ATPase